MSQFAATFCTSSSSSSSSSSFTSDSAFFPSTCTVFFGTERDFGFADANPLASSALFTACSRRGSVVTTYCSPSALKSSAPASSAASSSVSSS